MMRQLYIFHLLLICSITILPAQVITVWPGDASNNGITNHIDLLYWGLNYGTTGPARATVSTNWQPFVSPAWGSPASTGIDASYSDCNGDGNIDLADVAAIELNYYQFHTPFVSDSSSISNTPTAPSLMFSFPTDSFLPSQSYMIDINLGDFITPMDSLYGIALSVLFDSTLVDTAYADFSPSWLSGGGSSLVTLEKFSGNILDIGMTRTDRMNVLSSSGRIGGIVVVMVDNLKTSAPIGSLILNYPRVLAVAASGKIQKIRPIADSVDIFTGSLPPKPFPKLHIFPNPAKDELRISTSWNDFPQSSLSLIDVMGRTWLKAPLRNYMNDPIDVSALPEGIYFIEIASDKRKLVEKIGVFR